MKPTIVIRKATVDDFEQVTAFRIKQFQTAEEFKVVNFVSFSDVKGDVLVALIKDEIISTMQFQLLTSSAEFQNEAAINIKKAFSYLNTYYLSKGATAKEFRGLGLNSLLRLHILDVALKKPEIKSLTGVAYEKSPPLNLLQKIGYSLKEVEDLPGSNFRTNGKLFFVLLLRKNFRVAKALLEQELSELMYQYNIKNK